MWRVLAGPLDLFRDRPPPAGSTEAEEDAYWLRRTAAARRRYGARTARNAGLYACPTCSLLSDRPETDPAIDREEAHGAVACPRCGTELHVRKPASLSRTWAYILSAVVLYIPANLLPITDTQTLFSEQSDTIFSGIVLFWNDGSYGLALLVLFASIVVPMAKLLVLAGLAWSVQRRTLRKPAQRTRLYRIVEYIGRWSMLDVYVVAILTSLVQLKSLAQISAGAGVVAFAAVCVLTILASQAFDPRLIWDAFDEAHDDPDADDD